MVVDFVIHRAPTYRVATRTLVGSYPSDRRIRAEFETIVAWAGKSGVKTGRWFFRELDGPETPRNKRRWEYGIEMRSRRAVRGEKGLSRKVFPTTTVASVRFNPDKVSPMLVYHGLEGWLWRRKKDREFRESGIWREVYVGNPWKSKRAWANTEVQVPVKRLPR